MDNMNNTKPTYNNNGGQQQNNAAVSNKTTGITLSKPALIGGAIGCVAVGAGLGVVGCKLAGTIKAKRAEKKAAKAAAKSDKKE